METTTTTPAATPANFSHLPDSVWAIACRFYANLSMIAPERRWRWAFDQAGLNRYDGMHVQALANTMAGRSNLVPNPFKSKA